MAVSLVIGAAVYIYFKSIGAGMASFLAGILLDLDHLIDCYLNYGLNFKLRDLYNYCREIKFRKLSLIFHSYELLMIFWGFILIFSLGDIWKGIAIGMTQHILSDQLANPARDKLDRRTYFLTFRLKNKFLRERIVKD